MRRTADDILDEIQIHREHGRTLRVRVCAHQDAAAALNRERMAVDDRMQALLIQYVDLVMEERAKAHGGGGE